jgi:hypothetical protein
MASCKKYQLAKVHVKICQNLKPIFLQNLQDIRNIIASDGHTLMRGFLGMTRKVENKVVPLIHSVCNTNRPTIKAVLVPQENFDLVVEQFGSLHLDLLSGVPQDYHGNVFVNGLEAGMTSGHKDTIHSCNSSLNATAILQLHNPQDAEVEAPVNPQKRFKPTLISYGAVVTLPSMILEMVPDSTPSPPLTQQSSNISSLTDQDLDKLYERLKHHVNIEDGDSPGISTEEMERMVADSNTQIRQVRDEMRAAVADLSNRLK